MVDIDEASSNGKLKRAILFLFFIIPKRILNLPKTIRLALLQRDWDAIDIHAKDAKGFTALMEAIRLNSNEAADFLIRKGSDVNAESSMNDTPLNLAARNNNVPMICSLIASGANINGTAPPGLLTATPLIEAVRANAIESAQALIDHDADLNGRGSIACMTPLMYAAENNATEIANLLIRSGADVEAKTGSYIKTSALCFAAKSNAREMVELLLVNNAKTKCLRAIKKEIPAEMLKWLKIKKVI